MQAGSYGLPARSELLASCGPAHLPAGELFEIIPIPGNADLLIEIKVIATGIGTTANSDAVIQSSPTKLGSRLSVIITELGSAKT
jgi:hypothetical protein